MNLVCVSGLRIRPQNHPKKQALNNNTVVLQKCSLHSAEGSHEDFSSQLFGKVPGHAIYPLVLLRCRRCNNCIESYWYCQDVSSPMPYPRYLSPGERAVEDKTPTPCLLAALMAHFW